MSDDTNNVVPIRKEMAKVLERVAEAAAKLPSLPEDEVDQVVWDGDLSQLLNDTAKVVRRFVVLTDHQVVAISLWIGHTYVYEHARLTPYLHASSPDPGSGKTTLLNVLDMIVKNGQAVDGATSAVLFRMMHQLRPTLLYDEVDGVFEVKGGNEQMMAIRAILNSGYEKGKVVYRCDGPNNDLVAFNVFGPKAIAGLGHLPGTIAHRSISIRMQPPLVDEAYEDFDPEDLEPEARALRSRYTAWAATAVEDLGDKFKKPDKLRELDARRNSIWRILFRIADLAGQEWSKAARTAAITLSSDTVVADERSLGIRLLSDIRDVFDAVDRMSSEQLASALVGLEEAPWSDLYGKTLTKNGLAKRLKPYGVTPRRVRMPDETTPRGYLREQFHDAWGRYLPDIHPGSATPATNRMDTGFEVGFKTPQEETLWHFENPAEPHGQRDVAPVALQDRYDGPESNLEAEEIDTETLHDATCLKCDEPVSVGSGMYCEGCSP